MLEDIFSVILTSREKTKRGTLVHTPVNSYRMTEFLEILPCSYPYVVHICRRNILVRLLVGILPSYLTPQIENEMLKN